MKKRNMTFDKFRATRLYVEDLNAAGSLDEDDGPRPGFQYAALLYIEHVGNTHDGRRLFMLNLGNDSEISAHLGELERKLYAWGCDECALQVDK